jgi:hypothetical protein
MAVMQRSETRMLGQIVYVGPGLSGKTTNLTVLAAMLPKTRLTMFPTANERTAFFDELPVRVPLPGGWHAAFRVQTVPGQAHAQYRRAREMLLASPDAVVFVADSDPRRMAANRHALDEVKGILAGGTRPLEEVPLVYQYNKQDVPGALRPDEMHPEINPEGAPYVLAEAVRGVGIVETLGLAVARGTALIVSDFGLGAGDGGR